MVDGKHEASGKSPWFNNGLYDALKFVALIFLPAVGALYFSLAGIWDLPKAQEVVGTITVVDTFLGVLLGLSKQQYDNSDERFDGTMVVAPEKNRLVLNEDVENLEAKKELVFKVENPQA